MAIKPDEIIRLRNEGMAYALRIAKDHGIEALQQEVKRRGYLRCSVRFSPEELSQSIDNMAGRIYNNMLTMVYAVLHDKYGWGRKQLTDFKAAFNEKVHLVGERDDMGHHWVRFEDYAEEANELFDLGIEIEKVLEAQRNNDENDDIYIKAETAAGFLRKHGFEDAAAALEAEVFGRK